MSNRRFMRDLGVGLITTPTIMFCIPIWAAVSEPRFLLEEWDCFLPCIALPYAIGAALIWRSVKRKPVETPE